MKPNITKIDENQFWFTKTKIESSASHSASKHGATNCVIFPNTKKIKVEQSLQVG